MGSVPFHWYVATVVIGAAGVAFGLVVRRQAKSEWLRTGRSEREWRDQTRRNGWQTAVFLVAIGCWFHVGRRFPLLTESVFFPLVPALVVLPLTIREVRRDHRSWVAGGRKALGWWKRGGAWVLLTLALSVAAYLVVPYLLALP